MQKYHWVYERTDLQMSYKQNLDRSAYAGPIHEQHPEEQRK